MIYSVFIISILKICCVGATFHSDFTNLVIGFLKKQNTPTVIIDTCFNPNRQESVKFAKSITEAGFQISSAINLNIGKYQNQYLLMILDLDCSFANEIIQNASSQGLFKSPYRWLIIYGNQDETTQHPAYQKLVSSPVLTDSDLVIARHLGNNSFQLKEIYKPAVNSSMVENLRGSFDENGFVDFSKSREHFRRRKNLMLNPLTMINVVVDSNSSIEHIPKEDRLSITRTTSEKNCSKSPTRTSPHFSISSMISSTNPYSYILYPDGNVVFHEPQFDSLTKICWVIVHLGFQMLNATPRYTFANSFGYKNEAGKWNGAINMLITHQGDLATSCLPTHDRSEVVTFTEMVAKTEVAFILRQPPLSYVVSIYALPFSKSVWVASIVCTIISGLTLFIATKWESYIETSPVQPDGTLGDAFLLTVSAVCQQGCVLEPKKISGRMIVLFTFTALMALYAAYSANIVVLLRAPSHAITSLHKLYDSKMTLAANDVDYNHFLLKAQTDPLRHSIYNKIAGKTGKLNFYKLDEGVQRIRQGLFAFHSMKDPVYRRIERTFHEIEKCDLVEIDVLNQFEPLLPAAKDSPYNELFKVVFKRIRESGLQDAVIRRLQVSKPKCSGSVQAFSSVGIIDFYPAIIFMLYGFCLAFFILVMEIIVHKIHKRTHNNHLKS